MHQLRHKIGIAAASFLIGSATQAGFVVERAPEPAAAAAPAKSGGTAPAPAAGRNVDLSAKVARIAKMNRQRVDLESKVTSRITQSGTPPAELEVLHGMGRGVTLEDALRQMLPAGWTAYSDQDLPAGRVDWDGKRTWPMALHSVLARYDMRAHMDWETQELMLFVPGPKQLEAAAAAAGQVTGQHAGAVPAPVWTLSTEKTLRENLRTWASAAGWNLVWSAAFGDTVVDYPVDARVEFSGELVGTAGAMAKVIAAYSDADRPLEIEFFKGNKVVEVRLHRIPDTNADASGAPSLVPRRAALPPPPPTPVYVPAVDPASGA